MNIPELLLPVGNFDCLKAAVQNGADAVYLGASNFNARNSATNFDYEELERAIDYAHLSNVKVHLTLNTLIKNEEFEEAIKLAKYAYEIGIDAIIVQDLGLAKFSINNIPDLPIHASTQMTCHNLVGAKHLEELGFKRIVLSRELSLDEMEYIKSNIKAEIEVFAHGALCISYSGQCLYSSLIGGRSGNRGKCAQGCRLPYELLENNKTIDKGYLLSPRDLCTLEMLPELLKTGVDSLKIEGRMKSPEYVATVARIYRKYLDLAISEKDYIIEKQDKKDLLQVFNRGNFSTGHLKDSPNKELIFKEKPNNTGIFLGKISKINNNKGHVTFLLEDKISVGDTITFEHEPTTYRVSELISNNKNIETCDSKINVTVGRMKGNIHINDKIYKIADKELFKTAQDSYAKEYKKIPLNCCLEINLDKPIKLTLSDNTLNISVTSNIIPNKAINSPISKERLETCLNKTNDTPFIFKNTHIDLDDNLFVPIGAINDLRRKAIEKYSELILNMYKKTSNFEFKTRKYKINEHSKNSICLLLNYLDDNLDYSMLKKIDKLYIPLKYFSNNKYENILAILSTKFNIYIYMPSILRANFRNLFKTSIENCLEKYNIKGFVISNIGEFELLKDYYTKYEFIANYSLNIFNNHTLHNLNCKSITISPELNKDEINELANNTNLETEFIVYGRIPLMTSNYCLLGNSNKCYPDCKQKCNSNNKYYLKDRMNFKFPIIPDNIQTITTIYNSKINSIDTHEINLDNLRIDIIDENIEEINKIIEVVKSHNKLEGKKYTNGNLNRCV